MFVFAVIHPLASAGTFDDDHRTPAFVVDDSYWRRIPNALHVRARRLAGG